ncbi:MAG TPA: tRNA adenosine(34) deaminase TadA [Porticoccaceae bacterium]|nr:tRNA adenosine(34) deaminase TadA [Porticoccaceae bacterium]
MRKIDPPTEALDEMFMRDALVLAERAMCLGEVPVGAVLTKNGEIIADGHNQPLGACDPTAHAELVALRKAGQLLNNYRLVDCELYVTIEPCVMCVGALLHARIKRLVFGAAEPRAGAVQSHLKLLEKSHFNHTIEWRGGVLAADCGALMQRFFREKRGG